MRLPGPRQLSLDGIHVFLLLSQRRPDQNECPASAGHFRFEKQGMGGKAYSAAAG